MNPTPAELAVAGLLFAGLTAYALFAGADFGGGIWDLLAGSTRRGARPRALIDESVTPVWEANHVYLILALVVLWTAFPPAFAAIMTAMFVPLNLSLLGIVGRGIGFAFRHSAHRLRAQQFYGAMFAVSSLVTPFFLGTVVGAIVTGGVRAPATGNRLTAWTSPTALLIGGFAVASCAYIGSVFLVHDANTRHQQDLVRYFRARAVAAGIFTGLLAAASLASMRSGTSRHVFDGLLGRALPLTGASVAAGTVALILMSLGWIRGVREAAALAVATAVWAWGVAQYPWLLPGTLTLHAGSAPFPTMVAELVTAAMVVAFVVPGFVYLYVLQQRSQLRESDTSGSLREAVAEQRRAEAARRTGRPLVQARAPITARAGRTARRLARLALAAAGVAAIVGRARQRVPGKRRRGG